MIVSNRAPLVLLALVGLLLAGWVLPRELVPYTSFGEDAESSAEDSLLAAPLDHPLSRAGQQALAMICLNATASDLAALRPEGERQALAKNCAASLAPVAKASPAEPLVQLALATAAAEMGKIGQMNQALRLSQVTAPNEEWLGARRVEFAESRLADLDAATAAGNDADLAMLVSSQRGIAAIADRYVADTAFRARILAIVEKLPPGDQRRFVDSVKRAAAH